MQLQITNSQFSILNCITFCVCASALLANPLTPEQELGSFHLADTNLVVELVASEPHVISPVAITWDADGRLFVAEMFDYPVGPMKGRVKLLEDSDGNGHYEKSSVFADQLAFPNSLLPWKDGLLVTAAPDILYLRDTDSDGRCDERQVLFTGFGTGNTQLRVNGLLWGIDNWVYGANGRNDGQIRRSGNSTTNIISIRKRDFRFRLGMLEFEALAGQSQFGLGRDDWGNRFLSWNTIAVRHEVLPERYLSRNPHLSSTESIAEIVPSPDKGEVFPLTPDPLTFNKESTRHFNALGGLIIYRGDALSEKYRGNAFVGETLRNLVHRRVLQTNGVTFVARRGEEGREFLASTDPWFHPVNFATGPDGALYVVDFYRRFVEHPDYVPEKLRASQDWRTGAEHGRIWRVRDRRLKLGPTPRLSSATAKQLVEHFEHPNGWWRDTAQRLIVERQDKAAIPLLKSMAANSRPPEGGTPSNLARLHALWTLEGLGALDEASLMSALQDSDARIREHAIRLCEPRINSSNLVERLARMTNDSDARVLLQLALTLGEVQDDRKVGPLVTLANANYRDHWNALALLSNVGASAWPFLQRLLADPSWLNDADKQQTDFLEKVAIIVGAAGDQSVRRALKWLADSTRERSVQIELALMAGLGDGILRSGKRLFEVIEGDQINLLTLRAAALAQDRSRPTWLRLLAIRALNHASPPVSRRIMLTLLEPRHPAELQSAAAQTMITWRDADSAAALFSKWSIYSTSLRRKLVSLALQNATGVRALLDALDQGTVTAIELDASARAALQRSSDAEVKLRAQKLFTETANSDREALVRRYHQAIELQGNASRGAEIFRKNCVICHTVEGTGANVGPILSGLSSRPPEALLIDIIDPSRQVSPDYIGYTVAKSDDETLTGLIVAESDTTVTVRRPNLSDEVIPRAQIKEIRADGKSLMPDGLEKDLSIQNMADLLEFLKKPEDKLLRDGSQ